MKNYKFKAESFTNNNIHKFNQLRFIGLIMRFLLSDSEDEIKLFDAKMIAFIKESIKRDITKDEELNLYKGLKEHIATKPLSVERGETIEYILNGNFLIEPTSA